MSERKLVLGTTDFSDLAADILASGNLLRFKARGTSMYPFIKDGDALEFELLDPHDVRPADVVLFWNQRNHRLVVHRVIRVTTSDSNPRLITQGDALYHSDGSIDPRDVLGKLTAIIRKGKYIDANAWSFRVLSLIWNAFPSFTRKIYRVFAKANRSICQAPSN